MAVTKKNFEEIAGAIYWATVDDGNDFFIEKEGLVAKLIKIFAAENPRFDGERFRKACSTQPNGDKI